MHDVITGMARAAGRLGLAMAIGATAGLWSFSANASDPADSGWRQIHQHLPQATNVDENFHGSNEHVGNYRRWVTIYSADNSADTAHDWYLVQIDFEVNIQNWDGGHENRCGWWIDRIEQYFDGNTVDGNYKSFLPGANVGSSSSGSGFSIGISGDTPGASYSVSKSYSTADIQYKPVGDPSEQLIHWVTGFKGCTADHAPGKIWNPAPVASRSSYQDSYYVIAYVPKGSHLYFSTRHGNELSSIEFSKGFTENGNRKKSSYTHYIGDLSFSCSKEGCSESK